MAAEFQQNMLGEAPIGIEFILRELTEVARHSRSSSSVCELAYRLTDREVSRQRKVGAIVDYMHRTYRVGCADPLDAEMLATPERLLSGFAGMVDADEACLFVLTLLSSVGIRCRLVGARYGQSWTCWVSYDVGDRWETVDPLRQRPEREPDERVLGPIAGDDE